MKIAVYLGSNAGTNPHFLAATKQLGDYLGEHHTLVYGGANLGLMNELASHALDKGGSVIGVMPEFMVAQNRHRLDLEELIITKDMASRKKKMMDLSDAYIALPGGPGTLEEIVEVISGSRLGLLKNKPCILVNMDGYYDLFKQLLEKMIQNGFAKREELRYVYFPTSIQEVIEILEKEDICQQ